MDLQAILTGAGTASNPVGFVTSALSFLGGLFKKKNNPNDWKGWDALDSQYNSAPGNQAAHWTVNDGDSVSNEALNIVQYITQKPSGLANILTSPIASGYTPTEFLRKVAEKVRRGGFASEADQLLHYLDQKPVNNQIVGSFPTNNPPIVQTTFIDPNTYTVGGYDYYDTPQPLGSNKLLLLVVPLVIVATLLAVFWKGITKMFK